MQDGKRCSGAIPYGYKRNPEDKNHLLIDEEAAKVVRRIFQMIIDGMGTKAIANKLSEEKVLIPSAYLEQSEHGQSRNHSYHDPYRWNCTAVAYILEKQEYMGHTVLGKRDLLPPPVWTALLFGLRKTPVLCKPTLTAQSRRKNLRCRQQLPLSYLQIHVRRVYDALYQGIHSGQSG